MFGGGDPQQQGLLAAAAQMLQASGPSLMPHSFGQVAGAGLQGYQQAQQQAQEQAMNALRLKALQGELSDKAKARTDALAAQQWMVDYNKPDATAPARAVLGGDLAPTVANADKLTAAWGGPTPPAAGSQGADPYGQKLALARAMRMSGNPVLMGRADEIEKQAHEWRPKYSTEFRPGMGADGQLHNYVLADDGTQKDTGLGVKPEMTEVDLGGTKQFVDKNRVTNGQTFDKTMTFADRSAAARLAFDKNQAETNQDAPMDPLAVHFTAQQALAGDTSAFQNFGRGAQGAQNLKSVREEMTRMALAQGMSGSDLAAKVAEFGGLKAGQRTAATRSANIEIAAQEVDSLAPLALEASAKVARSGFLPFGKVQVMFDTNTNDPDLRRLAMSNTALVNAYGQVMARGGTGTVSDKDHARELLATAFDQPSYAAAVAQLQKETRAAQAAPKAVQKSLSDSVTGRGETVPNPVAAPASQFSVTAPNGKTYTFGDAKSLANFKLSAGIQ
jgi:hypothetical protein